MEKKQIYKPKKGSFNLDEKKSLMPYTVKKEQKRGKNNGGKR